MKTQILIISCIATLALISCGGSKEEKLAKLTVSNFFKALKTGDTAKRNASYPNFKKLPSHYKSDSLLIVSTTKENDKFLIKVHNRFTNIKGKIFEQDIDIFVTIIGEKAVIENSKGMYNAKEQELYSFAIKTGCLKENAQINDVEMAEQLSQAADLLIYKSKDLVADLVKQVPLSNLTWKNSFGVGMGNAVVKNNSPYILQNLKFKLFLTDDAANLITTNEGYVSYDSINPGETHKFEFMATQIEGAKHLDLQLVYDKYFLLDCLKNKSWTGKEYEEWKKTKTGK